ncbi:hypothetical protein Tco_0914529 [Tanacetum coccineum]
MPLRLALKLEAWPCLHATPHAIYNLGYTQEEGIDYDEVFASVARIEAISSLVVSEFAVCRSTRISSL